MPTGALLVDKPEGLSSHDVVHRVRGIVRETRCGHTGTLDPIATGLLVLCLGRATRLSRFVVGLGKTYVATVRFGFATDTYDRTGKPSGESGDDGPGSEELQRALRTFLGPQEQHPPPFSAKKVSGERAYRLARAGFAVQPDPVRVQIDEVELIEHSPPRALLRVSASSGTYIRSLAHDLGRKVGCGAHLESLRRTRVGSFQVEEALTLQVLESLVSKGGLSERLLSPAQMLQDLPGEDLTGEETSRFVHGRVVVRPGVPPGVTVRVMDPSGKFLGVARMGNSPEPGLKPLVVWAVPEGKKAQET